MYKVNCENCRFFLYNKVETAQSLLSYRDKPARIRQRRNKKNKQTKKKSTGY